MQTSMEWNFKAPSRDEISSLLEQADTAAEARQAARMAKTGEKRQRRALESKLLQGLRAALEALAKDLADCVMESAPNRATRLGSKTNQKGTGVAIDNVSLLVSPMVSKLGDRNVSQVNAAFGCQLLGTAQVSILVDEMRPVTSASLWGCVADEMAVLREISIIDRRGDQAPPHHLQARSPEAMVIARSKGLVEVTPLRDVEAADFINRWSARLADAVLDEVARNP